MPDVLRDELIKADIFRFFSLGFAYPDRERVEAVRMLARELRTIPEIPDVVKSALELDFHLPVLQATYSQLFIRGGIPLSETAYNPSNDVYSALAVFYQVFGLQPQSGDAPDTLSYELEFAAVLCLKVVLAQTAEQREVAKEAYQRLLANHLVHFVTQFHMRLKAYFPDAVYTRLASSLKDFLHQEHPMDILPVPILLRPEDDGTCV